MNRWHSETVAQLLQELDARPGGLSPIRRRSACGGTAPMSWSPPGRRGCWGGFWGS